MKKKYGTLYDTYFESWINKKTEEALFSFLQNVTQADIETLQREQELIYYYKIPKLSSDLHGLVADLLQHKFYQIYGIHTEFKLENTKIIISIL